jgi:ABC-type nitrate/sulfonate/bicarbonate transport system substrate-binding protein
VVGTGANQAPFYIADNLKAFDQYGVTVNWQLIAGDIATNALIAKEVDAVLESPTPMITVDLNGGGDQVLVASTLNHSTYALMAPASIQTADLKGKIVGNDRPATAQDYNTQLVLNLAGVKPSDVMFQPLGGVTLLYPALLSGQIQAAALTPPFIFQAQAKGFKVLATTYKESYQSNGVAVSKARIEELSRALPGVLAGLRAGIRAFQSQPDLATKIIQQTTKEEDPTILKQSYDFYVNDVRFQEDLQPTLPGIQSILDSLVATVPAAKNGKPEQFVDLRLLDKLPA